MTIGFAFVAWGFNRIVARCGAGLGHPLDRRPGRAATDRAAVDDLPLCHDAGTNTIIRTAEIEADAFGLNAAESPTASPRRALLLSEYRKMHPGKWEEIVFYDHPSGYNRILMAMTWKAEQSPPAAP